MVFNNPELSDGQLRAIAAIAEQKSDAATLAFVAQLTTPQKRLATAKRAIALDRSLPWVLYFVASKNERSEGLVPIANELIALGNVKLREVLTAAPPADSTQPRQAI